MPTNTNMTISPVSPRWQYLLAIIIMAGFGVIAILALMLLRPADDHGMAITMILGFLAPTTMSLLALMKAQETHLSVNSRLDAIIAMAREASHAEGVLAGQAMNLTGPQGPAGVQRPPGETGPSPPVTGFQAFRRSLLAKPWWLSMIVAGVFLSACHAVQSEVCKSGEEVNQRWLATVQQPKFDLGALSCERVTTKLVACTDLSKP